MPTDSRSPARNWGRVAAWCLALLPWGCSPKRSEPTPPPAPSMGRKAPRDPERVVGSLISLIGRPDEFRGSEVSVSGYLVIDRARFPGHDGFLFLRKEDALLGFLNGVFVNIRGCDGAQGSAELPAAVNLENFARYSEKYVYVYGGFSAPSEASPSLELGSICGLRNVIIRHMEPPGRAWPAPSSP